ncbi:hypothetical protein N0V93_005959 [Gnomoniopsis smithogilvyi]|uniref:Secreted protein n=1 Tax=Gnomoniopsis smithogilvyi TaxID=1191159 RepID=A0A9W8YVP4_9PEZI|nr:hypothetical protein N0V93_005959 [Gnomoniopsis smithogilvyi]
MWTLGCLCLEFLCWALQGHVRKLQFDGERSTTFFYGAKTDVFFDIKCTEQSDDDSIVVEVKKEVTKKLDELHADAHCTDWMHDLLNMIEQDMLMVDPREWKDSSDLLKELRLMDTSCQKNDRYCLHSAVRQSVRRKQTSLLAQLNDVAKMNIRKHGTYLEGP